MKHLHIHTKITLPDDHFDAAEIIGKAKPVMEGVRDQLREAGVEHTTTHEIAEDKPARKARVSKPKPVVVPDAVSAEHRSARKAA